MPRLEQRHTDLAHGLSIVLDREADVYREGVAGRKVPLRREQRRGSGWGAGGGFLPSWQK